MLRFLLVIGLLFAWVTGATWVSARQCFLGGYCGVFLRTLIGYMLIISFSHFFYLLLPKFGLGKDSRGE
jgi:hypothetical protein